MRRAALLLVAAVATLSASSARATMVISSDRGGLISDYAERFLSARAAGERVVIDGPCYSACTLVLSTIPGDRICVTRRAVLGFHAARLIDRQGRPLESKSWADAEALARDRDGSLLVAFERLHRLWRYPREISGRALPVAVDAPAAILELSANTGIEAMTVLEARSTTRTKSVGLVNVSTT